MRSKPLVASLALVVVLFALPLLAQNKKTEFFHGQEVAGYEVLVKFVAAAPESISQAEQAEDIDKAEGVGGGGWMFLHSRSKDAATLVRELSARGDVIYAEPNFIVYLANEPNDARFGELWGMRNTGQVIQGVAGTPGADISAVPAWDISTGSRANVVGVVDTGIFYQHPDLTANIWSAPFAFTVTIGGVPITCDAGTHGYDAIRNTCNPLDNDPNTHGTHVAGTIGAVGNNGLGVAGVNWAASMMALKMFDVAEQGDTATAINAIEFAVQAKRFFASIAGANVRVLNNSWVTSGFSQALLDEINIARDNEILFVAAAGNGDATGVGFDIDTTPVYPASYGSPINGATNVLAVAATDNRDARAGFSNFGATSVHLGAPGVNVLSTTLANGYGYKSGTSMATPHVSGAAALILSHCNLTTAELKAALLNNVDPIAALAAITVTGGRLNVNRAIRSVCLSPRFAYVPNAGDGTVSIYSVNDNSGQLRANGYVPAGRSPLSVVLGSSGQFAYVANHDSNDISAYRIDANTGTLTPIDGSPFPAGTGPRSVATDPSGLYLYVANENSGNVSVFSVDGVTGALTAVGSPILAGTNPFSVAVDPLGRFVYVANFSSDSISAYNIDAVTGSLTPAGTFLAGLNPRTVTVDSSGQYVYVANMGAGTISAYTIDPATGALTTILGSPFPAEAGASAVTVSPSGKFAYVPNASAGSISAYNIDAITGAFNAVPGSPFPAGNQPLALTLDPGEKYAFVTHGLANEVWVYSVAPEGALRFLRKMRTRSTPYYIAVSAGVTPVTYTPKFAYTAHAIGRGGVSAFTVNATTGGLTIVPGSPFAAAPGSNSAAVHPSGKFLYVGGGGVSAYNIDVATGALTPIAGSPFPAGVGPRGVAVEPSGRFGYVANSGSNNVSAFAIDATTGALTEIPGSPFPAQTSPYSAVVDSTGRFLYVSNSDSSNISGYAINVTSGVLTSVPGSPFPTQPGPAYITVDPTGQFVYAQSFLGTALSAFNINRNTGELTAVAGSPFPSGASNQSVTVDPWGNFAYVVHSGDTSAVSAFTITNTSGVLAEVPGSMIPVGMFPQSVAVDSSGRFVYVSHGGNPGTVSGFSLNAATGILTPVPGSPFDTTGIVNAFFVTTTGTIQ